MFQNKRLYRTITLKWNEIAMQTNIHLAFFLIDDVSGCSKSEKRPIIFKRKNGRGMKNKAKVNPIESFLCQCLKSLRFRGISMSEKRNSFTTQSNRPTKIATASNKALLSEAR